MLGPDERQLLLEALRPPEEYHLDVAIGTTYTLDLLALLTAPLAFTFFEWEDEAGRPVADPLALMEAVRRNAQRIHIFCQAGGMKVPRPGQLLDTWIEESVVDVSAPHGGVFHPKVWVLRFEAPDQPVRYRFLCLSRNLTFDRSWDTALVLDGELKDRTRAIRRSRPLAEFIEALPGMAVRAVSPRVAANVRRLADELPRVDFEAPPGVEEITFHPIGLRERRPSPFPERIRRLLVCSPFLTAGWLGEMSKRFDKDKKAVLISRCDELEQLPATALHQFEAVYTMRPEADPEVSDEVYADTCDVDGLVCASEETPAAPARLETLSGLHAKLYVHDDGWNASVWTGSANATTAAFNDNVEFLVELRGKKSEFGIEAFLTKSESKGAPPGFLDLLAPWTRSDIEGTDEQTAARRRAEARLDEIRCAIASSELRVVAAPSPTRTDGGSIDDDPTWSLEVRCAAGFPKLPDGASLKCWPSRLPAERALLVEVADLSHARASAAVDAPARALVTFEQLSTEALTTFIAFELRLEHAGEALTSCFALNLPADGFLKDRESLVLRALLGDREHVLRLLWMLLSREKISVEELIGSNGSGGRWKAQGGYPLLEALLETLAREPARLDDIRRLVEDLNRTPEGRELLPEGFLEVWEPIRVAWAGGQ